MKKTIVYEVFDEEWSAILGINQLKEFATCQVLNCADDFIEKNLKDSYENWEEILNLANKILFERYEIQTIEEVKLIFQVRCFDIEEVTVY